MIDSKIEIKLLDYPENVRTRSGMYVGGLEDSSVIFREIIDNAFDESYACSWCNQVLIDQNWNGYHLVMDNGRGLPIVMSPDKPGQTMADLAVSCLHSGSKFDTSDSSRVGQNGVGSAVCNALSESFIVLSRVTQDNYDKSIKAVYDLWNSTGPRSKKELYYIVAYERGYKVYEGAGKKKDIESQIFAGCPKGYSELPEGYSTIILFKPDPTLFESTKSKVPVRNIQYFLLIQEKFYKRKINVIVNGESLGGTFQPYKYEVLRTIVPADTSKNKFVSMYLTFEVDPSLGGRTTEGSVGGLVTDSGHHIQIAECCFEEALRSEFRIKHRCIFNGLKMCVVVLAAETIFDSQTKTRLKSITKVKASDFGDVVKDIIKVFRSDPDYWGQHVEKLNYLAESMKSLSAVEKAEKLKSGTTAAAGYKLRSELQGKFVDAIAGQSERYMCELFIVEGNSAGGSLTDGRKGPKYHAVLPLRGRVVNTEGMDEDKMLDNKEMYTLFKAIGLGLDINNVMSSATTQEEAMELLRKNARYGKIIISTDADADGSIIASGLLYTFSRFARFMIDLGMVYLIESPIFSQDGKYFFPSDPTVDGEIPVGLNLKKHFRRYKGLGSLNSDEVYEAFYNPAKRRLIQVTPDGIDYAMSLVEDIQNRKNLLVSKGILGNPYGLFD
jgi:DNA gyrase/topoisomerase IV subunit B